jgi:hypothetical protein
MPFPLLLAHSFFRILLCLSRLQLLMMLRVQEDDTDNPVLAGRGGLGDGLMRQGRAAAAVVDEGLQERCSIREGTDEPSQVQSSPDVRMPVDRDDNDDETRTGSWKRKSCAFIRIASVHVSQSSSESTVSCMSAPHST